MAGMLASVKKGRIIRPAFMLVYGPGGIGKSTWASKAPNPIFLGAEQGTDLLDVSRLPMPQTLDDVHLALRELMDEPHDYKTLVVDSVDWVEPLIFDHICRIYKTTSIVRAAGGYGKGYNEAADIWTRLVHQFNLLRDKRGMNVILLAHPEVKTVTNPQTQLTYQRYELKLHKLAKAKIQEAVDAIFFASFEMYTRKDGDEVKTVVSENRVLQGVPNQHDGFDAKNRYGLTASIPMDMAWDDFVSHCSIAPTASADDVKAGLVGLLALVEDETKRKTMVDYIETCGDNVEKLLKVKERMIAITQQ